MVRPHGYAFPVLWWGNPPVTGLYSKVEWSWNDAYHTLNSTTTNNEGLLDPTESEMCNDLLLLWYSRVVGFQRRHSRVETRHDCYNVKITRLLMTCMETWGIRSQESMLLNTCTINIPLASMRNELKSLCNLSVGIWPRIQITLHAATLTLIPILVSNNTQ